MASYHNAPCDHPWPSDQLIARLASHGQRDQRTVGIALITIRASEAGEIVVGKAREPGVLLPAKLALKRLHFVQAVQSVMTRRRLDHQRRHPHGLSQMIVEPILDFAPHKAIALAIGLALRGADVAP